jgi:molecular chaperone GrpE
MENQDINEESINNQEDTNIQNEATSEDNVTAQPTAEELLAEEKTVTSDCMLNSKTIKKEPAKRKWNFSSMPIRI